MCVCESSYFGEKCERSLKNFCNNKKCLNGGSCIYNEEENFASCVCLKGYIGESCQEKSFCLKPQNTPCYNNGTCLVGPNNIEFCNFISWIFDFKNGFKNENSFKNIYKVNVFLVIRVIIVN